MCGRRLCAEKTGSTLWTRPARFCGLWIAGAFVLLLIVVVVRFLSSSEKVAGRVHCVLPLSLPPIPEPVKMETLPAPRRFHRTPQSVFDSEADYSTIIDNPLFRPLGWRPPRPIEPYRLLGTKLARVG